MSAINVLSALAQRNGTTTTIRKYLDIKIAHGYLVFLARKPMNIK